MKYPDYPGDLPDRGPDLACAVIQQIGSDEPDNREAIDALNHQDPHYASLLVGRACSILVTDDRGNTAADRMLQRANRAITTATDRPGANAQIRHLPHLIDLLLARDDPQAVSRYQMATHAGAVAALAHITGSRKEKAGSATHWRGVGLLNRFAHPWFVATSSLPHLDNGHRHSANYDLLTVETGPSPETPTAVQIVQLKHECLGFCGDPAGAEHGKEILDGYSERVVLVSNHCDMHAPDAARVDHLLRREMDGVATPDEIEILDTLTNGLILTITNGDDRRRGRRKNQPIAPYRPSVLPYKLPAQRSTVTPASVATRVRR